MRKPVDMTKFASSVTKKMNVSHGFNDPHVWISTGNFILNYLISGDFNKGVPLSKVTMFAGDSGSGKSFIASGKIVKNCQDRGIMPVIFDSENALDEQWLKDLGVDTDPEKLLRFQVSMINDVGKIMSEFIEMYRKEYMDLPKEEQPCFMFIVDSLGMLLTETDVDQFDKGDMKGDMGRKPKQLNALVRNVVNQVADKNIGVVFTNHTYASQDIFDPDDKISGGCLVADTNVLTDNGPKPIQNFEVGDKVLSSDGQYHDVIQTWHYEKETYELELEDGTSFECSPEHKFLVKDDNNEQVWKEIQIMSENDVVYTYSEDILVFKVKSITKTNNIKDVYDIQVEDTGEYILADNNVVSHNSGQIFASSIVVASKKLKLKTDDEGNKTSDVNGIRSMVKIMKSRYGRAYETAKLNIRFDSGLEPYSGCLDYFEKLGVIQQVGNKLQYIDKNGNEHKQFRKKFEADHDLLQKIIDEWDYDKYRLISSEQVENSSGLVTDQEKEELKQDSEEKTEDDNSSENNSKE